MAQGAPPGGGQGPWPPQQPWQPPQGDPQQQWQPQAPQQPWQPQAPQQPQQQGWQPQAPQQQWQPQAPQQQWQQQAPQQPWQPQAPQQQQPVQQQPSAMMPSAPQAASWAADANPRPVGPPPGETVPEQGFWRERLRGLAMLGGALLLCLINVAMIVLSNKFYVKIFLIAGPLGAGGAWQTIFGDEFDDVTHALVMWKRIGFYASIGFGLLIGILISFVIVR